MAENSAPPENNEDDEKATETNAEEETEEIAAPEAPAPPSPAPAPDIVIKQEETPPAPAAPDAPETPPADEQPLAAGAPLVASMVKKLNIVQDVSAAEDSDDDGGKGDDDEQKQKNEPQGVGHLTQNAVRIPIDSASPTSASDNSQNSPIVFDVHSQVHAQVAAERKHVRRKQSVATCELPIYVHCIFFIFLLPMEPLLYPLHLMWVHVFPPLIDKEDLFETHVDYFKILVQHLLSFIALPFSVGVYQKGLCKDKDTMKKFGVAYFLFVLLLLIFTLIWLVCAVVISVAVVIAAAILYALAALVVAIFAVLCFISSSLHFIVVKVWKEVIVNVLPFFDHPIVMDFDNDLIIRPIELCNNNNNKLFIFVGLFGTILYFPMTLISSVMFGLQKTCKHILRIHFVHIIVAIFVSCAAWVTGFIFIFAYYYSDGRRNEYQFDDISSVKSIKTSMVFLAACALMVFILFINSIIVYRKHCVKEHTFPSYLLLLPGFFLVGPIMVLAVPFWADRSLSISWWLWDCIWFKPKELRMSIDFDAARVRSYSKTLKSKNKNRKSKTNVLPNADNLSPGRRYLMMFSWIFFGIPTFLVYPIAFICEPLPNFPYPKIIIPFCNSLLFWASAALFTYMYIAQAYVAYFYGPVIVASISLFVLIVCCFDRSNFKYMSRSRDREDRIPFVIFMWIFFANVLSFPAMIFGLVWPAWPMTVMMNYNVDANIARDKAQESSVESPKFWAKPKSETTNCGRILACILLIFCIPIFIVWIVSYGGYNITRYEGRYFIVTFICSLLICASFIDWWFEFFIGDIAFVILCICIIFALLLSYFFVNVKGTIRVAIQFFFNFLTIIYFCAIFTLGLYGASIAALSAMYHGLLSFCGMEQVAEREEKHAKKDAMRYVE